MWHMAQAPRSTHSTSPYGPWNFWTWRLLTTLDDLTCLEKHLRKAELYPGPDKPRAVAMNINEANSEQMCQAPMQSVQDKQLKRDALVYQAGFCQNGVASYCKLQMLQDQKVFWHFCNQTHEPDRSVVPVVLWCRSKWVVLPPQTWRRRRSGFAALKTSEKDW